MFRYLNPLVTLVLPTQLGQSVLPAWVGCYFWCKFLLCGMLWIIPGVSVKEALLRVKAGWSCAHKTPMRRLEMQCGCT